MAVKTWLAGATTTRRRDRIVVNNATVNNTYIFSSNGRTVTYTAVTGDTTSTIATNWVRAINDSLDPEFGLFDFSTSTNTITVLGPEDGQPYSLSVSGTGSSTLTTLQAAGSPNDVAAPLNWSGSTLPTNGDSVIIEAGTEGLMWNANTALSAVNLISLTVRANFEGEEARIGNPRFSEEEFLEYRGTELVLNQCGTLTVNESQGAGSETYKFAVNSGAACAVRVFGQGVSGGFGQEVTYWRGMNAGNTIDLVGGSMAVAVFSGETAFVSNTKIVNGLIRFGDSCTLGTVDAISSQVLTRSNISTLKMNNPGTEVTTEGSASITTITIDEGTLFWNSTGSITTIEVGSNGILDLSGARYPLTITNPIQLHENGSINDPYGRVSTLTIELVRTEIQNVSIVCAPGKTVTIA